jgi:cardiolipin synthase
MVSQLPAECNKIPDFFWLCRILNRDQRSRPVSLSWLHNLEVQITVFISVAALLVTIPWILLTKRDSTSAVAWCLLVFFLPLFGSIFFVLFGYQHVHRPLKRKRRHMKRFGMMHAAGPTPAVPGPTDTPEPDSSWEGMSRLAQRFGAFPLTQGNELTPYNEGVSLLDSILEAIRSARHHVHLEYFIIQPDATGRRVLDLLAQKAREGVEVRLLYDAMGSRRLRRRALRPLRDAGGKCSVFLPLSPLRRRIQVNMRNHRKILVIDGRVAFTGGINIGDEYLGQVARFGFWRDTHLQVRGPAVAGLQRVFIEDWDFAAGEDLTGAAYFPPPKATGSAGVQVIHSGPDQELNGIREVYFAAILRARRRLWIASPYFVPDAGLMDALCLVGYQGVDVRLLGLDHPDKWIPLFAARYYWDEVLKAGVKVYQYTKGMMHSKVLLVDGGWASVGSANLDNRSLHLNFEANCLIYSPSVVADLERAFVNDLGDAIRLDPHVFAQRPWSGRIVENACRLLSPVL